MNHCILLYCIWCSATWCSLAFLHHHEQVLMKLISLCLGDSFAFVSTITTLFFLLLLLRSETFEILYWHRASTASTPWALEVDPFQIFQILAMSTLAEAKFSGRPLIRRAKSLQICNLNRLSNRCSPLLRVSSFCNSGILQMFFFHNIPQHMIGPGTQTADIQEPSCVGCIV